MKCSSQRRSRIAAALIAISGAGLSSSAANAQVVGTYQGVTSQGQTIEVTLIQDANGAIAFGGGVVFWQATCSRSGAGRSVAWGLGANVPLVDGQTLTTEFRFNGLYERWRLLFAGNTMSGNFIGRTPEFVDPNESSRQVQLCDSGNLSFNGTLVPGARSSAPLASGQAMSIQ